MKLANQWDMVMIPIFMLFFLVMAVTFFGCGDDGAPGQDGISYTGDKGQDGQDGAVGPQGIPGPQGEQGPEGLQGAPGEPGFNSLLRLNHVVVDKTICKAKKALQIDSGLDVDRSGTLEDNEVAVTNFICELPAN